MPIRGSYKLEYMDLTSRENSDLPPSNIIVIVPHSFGLQEPGTTSLLDASKQP